MIFLLDYIFFTCMIEIEFSLKAFYFSFQVRNKWMSINDSNIMKLKFKKSQEYNFTENHLEIEVV